jgi:hypothetical protein
MACIRSRSKIWYEGLVLLVLIEGWILPKPGWGAFASQFSLNVEEQYNDNIFFTRNKEHDFVTSFTPTLSFLYAPEGQVDPTGRLNISPRGQIYARHSELNNFGDNLSVNGAYTYHYSPRLNFNISDTFQRLGQTRTAGLGGQEPLPLTGPVTSPPPPGGIVPPPRSQDLKDFVSRGDQITNSFSLQASYLYRPDIRLAGGYTHAYTNFIDQGGSDFFHTIGARGIYNWRRDHNLHAGYFISIGNFRNGDDSIIHNFDFGDDYFTDYKLQLTPTLSLTASTGVSFNTGSGGPRVANNTHITVTKLWETATLNAGLQKGLTPSFGISGVSDTTTLFTNFIMRFTERLSANSGVNFSLFDTREVNFKTFQGTVGLQYLIATWLSSALNYNFRWIDTGAGASNTDLLSRGQVKANSVFLSLTARFDLWPNVRLARSVDAPLLTPILRTPFADSPPVPSSSASPNP